MIDARIRESATARQREILDAVDQHGSTRKAAAALGIDRRNVQRAIELARKKAGLHIVGQNEDVPTNRNEPCAAPVSSTYCKPPDEPAPSRPFRRIVAIPDVHAPYHDEAAYELAIKAIKTLKPHVIVIIGDFADCYAISSFPKTPERRQSLKWEIEEVEKCLRRLDRMSDDVCYLEGNHEERLERYLCQKAPELYGLVTMRDLLNVNKRGWSWTPYKQWIKLGKCNLAHEVGHFGKYAMQQSLASFGHSIVFGHSHRAGVHYEGTIEGEKRFSMNIGWLGDASKADYMHRAQTRAWQQGIGIIDQDGEGNSWAQFVPIVNGRMMIGGEVIS